MRRDRVCQVCGREEHLHAHHIVPRSEGGPDTKQNLVAVCKYCHPTIEGTRERPRHAAEGYRVENIAKHLVRDHLVRIAMSEDSIFKDNVQRHPDICNNCFRRTRERSEINYINIKGVPHHVRDSTSAIVSDDLDYAKWSKFYPGPDVGDGVIPYCECGFSKPGFDNSRPLDKMTFLEYGKNLADRYEEMGLDFEREKLLDELYELKSEPDNQFRDDEMYRKATDVAVAVTNTSTQRPSRTDQ